MTKYKSIAGAVACVVALAVAGEVGMVWQAAVPDRAPAAGSTIAEPVRDQHGGGVLRANTTGVRRVLAHMVRQ